MRLFQDRRKQVSPAGGRLAGKLAGRVLQLQAGAASWLNQRTKDYSSIRWLVLLALFCIGIGSVCLYLIITSIYK